MGNTYIFYFKNSIHSYHNFAFILIFEFYCFAYFLPLYHIFDFQKNLTHNSRGTFDYSIT